MKIHITQFYVDDPSTGLKKALSMLELAFGSKYKLSRAHLKKLLARAPVPPTELGLLEFYCELNSCMVVMKDCDTLDQLDSEDSLKTLYNQSFSLLIYLLS